MAAGAAGVCFIRVRTGCHTVSQVVAGFFSGAAGGVCWLAVCGDWAVDMAERTLQEYRKGPLAWTELPALLTLCCFGIALLSGLGRGIATRKPRSNALMKKTD